MFVTFPSVPAIDEVRALNPIKQIGEKAFIREGDLPTFASGRIRGFLFQPTCGDEEILIVSKAKGISDRHTHILQASVKVEENVADLTHGYWRRHPLLRRGVGATDYERKIQQIRESWESAFSYVLEDQERAIVGLRRPQIGAIHAVHAHWSVSDSPATIVMPTGTGKTDTMISILISVICPKLLVVVPTDALRTQLAEKFLTLGILRTPNCGILHSGAQYPIVCSLQHIPRNPEEVDDIFGCSQIIVTTSSIAGQCEQSVQSRMAYHCPYLFIDEAHHAEAPTWRVFKDRFEGRRILQFTATPFREDGKPLDGDIIFRYPLKKAQQEGYFKPIRFKQVLEFDHERADKAIVGKAIAQLREDANRGHILMARVESVERAKEVFELYKRFEEFNPVQLHTGIKSVRQREEIRRQIIAGSSRIVVCVDMLGEGFDLPELKIAAFHDIRKTLAVTLQLAGRFTRARPDLGDATFIANTADINVREELRKLYTQDPDWNVLLPELSETVIGEVLSLQDFLRGFAVFTKEIPLKSVRPATSAVVYRTFCTVWTPESFRNGIPGLSACEQVHSTINRAKHTLIVVTARRVPLDWTDVKSLFSWEWDLYVIIWSPDHNLLFINTSSNAGEYKALAKAVAGDNAILIKGQIVFRSFAGVNRLRFQNVGLTEQLGRNVRYTGRMGSDVGRVLTDAQRRHTVKSVLSGSGFENGQKTTVGASKKGRIWSHRREHIDKLAAWCKTIGTKLIDESIDPEQVLSGTLDVQIVMERPEKMPICVDWPEVIYTAPEISWSVKIGDEELMLNELAIEVESPSLDGPLRFAIVSETERAELDLELFRSEESKDYRFVIRDARPVCICRGKRSEVEDATDFFYEHPPVIWFSDGSFLEGNEYVMPRSAHPPYDSAKIQAWDWSGVDIRKESQGAEKSPDSIQARVIRELRTQPYRIVFDDDGKGEVADVVAIGMVGDPALPTAIKVEFYHCKYSQQHTPGQRIEDLYEVCGQAQKSVVWQSTPEKRTELFTHLLRREARRQGLSGTTRFELGDEKCLLEIREMSRQRPVSVKIFIVQPGVSKANVTRGQLELMGVTENYLMETFQLDFGVIASG